MKKRLKILVPIDLSLASNDVLLFAFNLATKVNATVEVLHAITVESQQEVYSYFMAVSADEKIKMARKKMLEIIDKAKVLLKDANKECPEIQTTIEFGIPDTQIIDTALSDQVDYIVMGTQGHNTVWERLLGSTALDVLKYSPCPVFVIPQGAKFVDDMVVGYATDYSDADPYEIWKTSKFFQSFNSRLLVFHINENGEYSKDKLRELSDFFKDNAPKVDIQFHDHLSDNIIDGAKEVIESHNIGLLAIYKPKHTLFQRMFNKSFTKEMTRNPLVPLLIYKEQ